MSDTLQGKSIIITGGTGALGRAVTGKVLEAGATCHIAWADENELDDYPHDHDVILYEVDCTNETAVAKFYSDIKSPWASLHLVGGFAMSPIEKTSIDDFDKMMQINARTCFLCSREAIKAMRTNGDGGRIVNIGARPAVQPAANMTAYATAKAAVASITRCAAEEVKTDNILINAVLPSIMDTPDNRAAMPQADFDDWPKVEEVAEAIAFLASPANTLTNGALVPVYGHA